MLDGIFIRCYVNRWTHPCHVIYESAVLPKSNRKVNFDHLR